MASGNPGRVTDYSDPPSIILGTPATPQWAANMTLNLNSVMSNMTTYQQGGLTTGIAAGAAAGTGGVLFVGTSAGKFDQCGDISVRPGASGVGSGVLATVTFGNATAYPIALTNGPAILLTPGNAAAAALSGSTQVWTTQTVGASYYTGWQLNVGAALSSGTLYRWWYWVIAG